jgi:hypothetical protein
VALRSGNSLKGAAVAVLAIVLLAGLGLVSSGAAMQDADATIENSVVLIVQGETDAVAGTEGKNDFYALKILNFNLPYDVSRVYTSVPVAARDIAVWSGTNTFGQSQYGTETSGTHAGDFFIDVPTSHPRTSNYSVRASSVADFTTPGSQLSNLNFSSGDLTLANESMPGTYISPNITIPSAASIQSVLLSVNGNSTGNITRLVSTDGGSSWWSVVNATPVNITSGGIILRIMLELTGNSTLGYDTSLSSFQLTATYVQLITVFTVHVSYLWTSEFSDRKTSIDLTEPLPFSTNSSFVVMLYTLSGYSASSSDVQLVLDVNRTMNTYDDKDLYVGTLHPSGAVSYSADVTAPKASSNLALYSVIILFALALSGAYLYRNSKSTKRSPIPEAKATEAIGAPGPRDEACRKELVERKKALLSETRDIRAKLSSGEIAQADASAELARIKKDFKGVRNELNRMSRRASAPSLAESHQTGHESAIAALARIDEDFEKGRLPEGTYKALRKEYVQRAASMMAAQSASSSNPLSPVELEKNKLMEAIVALDDEREKDEINEKVYSDLSASYRKQLADLMRRSEEPKKEEE